MGYVRGVRGWGYVRWGTSKGQEFRVTLRGGLRWGTSQKCCFWAIFGKLLHFGKILHIGGPWINVFVRVLRKNAEIRVITYKI